MADNAALIMGKLAALGAANPDQLASLMANAGIIPEGVDFGIPMDAAASAAEIPEASGVGQLGKTLGTVGSALKLTQPTPTQPIAPRSMGLRSGGNLNPQTLQFMANLLQGGNPQPIPTLGSLIAGR